MMKLLTAVSCLFSFDLNVQGLYFRLLSNFAVLIGWYFSCVFFPITVRFLDRCSGALTFIHKIGWCVAYSIRFAGEVAFSRQLCPFTANGVSIVTHKMCLMRGRPYMKRVMLCRHKRGQSCGCGAKSCDHAQISIRVCVDQTVADLHSHATHEVSGSEDAELTVAGYESVIIEVRLLLQMQEGCLHANYDLVWWRQLGLHVNLMIR
jgi:hypothetical protein